MIKFVLGEMTYLRYFMPLMLEMNEQGIEYKMLIGRNKKYNNP